MESPAQHRLDVIESHLLSSSNAEDDSFLRHNLTSSSHFLNRSASKMERCDQGLKWHTVFVNNVSKRIHSKILKELFQSYGVVTDIFIAYRSRRRLSADSTFAFVRFRSKSEADSAVRRADGRIMDGFKIRVFHDNKGAPKLQRSEADRNSNKVWKPSLRDSRSFKEVVRGVQSAVCWSNREDWVSRWFDELELLEGYENKVKIKVWILFTGVPLTVWSEKCFMELGSLWGKVLMIEKDTCNRTRFDIAKILLEVQFASDIPEKVSIVCNGRLYSIKILTKVQEEIRIFIDGSMPNGGAWCSDVVEVGKDPSIEEEHADSIGSEAEFNMVISHALIFQRVIIRTIWWQLVGGSWMLRWKEGVMWSRNCTKVPIFVNDGPNLLFTDDSVELMALNRDVGQVWHTHSLSNNSRLLDIPIEEVSSFRFGGEDLSPNSRGVVMAQSLKTNQDIPKTKDFVFSSSADEGINGVENRSLHNSITPKKKKKSTRRPQLIQVDKRGKGDRGFSARETPADLVVLEKEAI
ncbi:hypothetical protein F3Y22_tig00111053pilonHSYRG00090 [Hibiscus syriacus]|uniref:RRM domain-containing protein n=1 Tax=Hibiscus syriacus TaxID=106335 RepID=A0A6A2Z3S3_HIBSY|nr:hypothetical protein F3Y22_tig00111053pilonHSYRG00090 [Hibiscus syriacus]